jgi:hypothetical protein
MKIGSSKVRNARKREAKEKEFLSSLSVQCDDEDKIDLVHDDEGNLLKTGELVKVVSGNSNAMRFVRNGLAVDIEDVKNALGVLANCAITIKKFTTRTASWN